MEMLEMFEIGCEEMVEFTLELKGEDSVVFDSEGVDPLFEEMFGE